jgi:hypothetical protein
MLQQRSEITAYASHNGGIVSGRTCQPGSAVRLRRLRRTVQATDPQQQQQQQQTEDSTSQPGEGILAVMTLHISFFRLHSSVEYAVWYKWW